MNPLMLIDWSTIIPSAGTAIFTFIILIALTIIMRWVFCWYWKINYRVKLLEEILKELKNGKPPQN